MPPTPDEAIAKNMGKTDLQFERAIRDLTIEVERAIEDYTGHPVYVGLPAYLNYRAQEDNANKGSMATLESVDRAIDERFGPAGWTASIVLNKVQSQYWVKLRDVRRS